MKATRQLLAIVEQGGYPDFSEIYQAAGYEVNMAGSVRSAIQSIKKNKPDVIVAEFNFQSDFRDRISNLESVLAVVERIGEIKVIVFYDLEFKHQFDRLSQNFKFHAALPFPVDAAALKSVL